MRLVVDCLISKHQIYSNMIFLPSICSFTLHIFEIGYHKITSFNWSDCSPCMSGWAGLGWACSLGWAAWQPMCTNGTQHKSVTTSICICNVAKIQMLTFSKDLFYQPDLLGPSKLEGKKSAFQIWVV